MRRSACGRRQPSRSATTEARPSAPTTSRARTSCTRGVAIGEAHARHRALLDDEVDHARVLAEVDRQRPHPLDQRAVERLARHAHRVLTVGPPRPTSR